MTSVGHAPPHENEDGVADKYRPVANGFHKETSHFENDCNGFIIGNGSVANESTKLLPPICDTSSVINSKHDEDGDLEKRDENHVPIDLSSEDNLLIPFPLLAGENVEQRILCSEANVILTNYRLFACLPESFHNIPVRTIEYVEMRELTVVHVNCKYGKVVRICLDTPEDCAELWRHITSLEASQLKTEDLFALKYFTNFNSPKSNGVISKIVPDPADCEAAMYVKDMKRMGFNTQTIWRTTEINSKFEVCKTYPKFHIVPAWISDDELIEVAQFRSMRRFPSVVWRSKTNGCVIARCSQPEVGWFGWRCEKDEHLLSAIAQAASLDSNVGTNLMSLSVSDMKPHPFLLVDARSYATAVANRAKGGGCECQEYYPTCEIQFMGLVNIHAIRKSFQAVRSLSVYGQEQPNWYSSLEKTGWLHYLSALIRSSIIIVEAIDVEKRSAVVHCTDGWDRTTQLVSLAELLLDPYYRTIKGFSVLVEREWLEFGHKFADRCGHSPDKNINEISPVFYQWVDAVHQIMKQFPSAFQFNESFLIKLVQHTYSCLFGTFLCNSIRERHQLKLKTKTASIWDLLLSGKKDFINFLYVANDKKVLYPSYHIRNMEFWENVFIGDTKYPDIPHRLDCTKTADFSDSGNFTQNSSTSNGGSKYSSNDVSNENHEVVITNGINDAINGTNDDESSLSDEESDARFTKSSSPAKSPNSKQPATEMNGGIKNGIAHLELNGVGRGAKGGEEEGVENGLETATTSTSTLTPSNSQQHVNCTNHCSPVELNNLSERISESLEDETSSTLSSGDSGGGGGGGATTAFDNVNSMSDSVKTITGDLDRPQSFDDSCIPVKTTFTNGTHHTGAEVIVDHHAIDRTAMRKVHSSPDSPKVTRLPRTKSVPDVMTASLCIENDMNSLESNGTAGTTKQINKELFRNLSRYIDCDGLTIIHNYIDHKLLNLELTHAQEIIKLQKRVQIERQARLSLQQQLQQMCSKDGEVFNPMTIADACQDDLLSLPDSVNGERSSISSLSNDEGWEQVQYDDVQPTRWIPDHVSSNCSHCGQQFSIILRRHHCRNCGAVFCDTCTSYQICIPDEQLYNPVRVCFPCYENILHSTT